ncbi:MAG TPA: potassium-transporting ATPase subunit C [Candidatus Limnocylindrales bacterium]|nr:potassium-transporting ATPase subunit C [Candidatus Limnocylindrales bacterium]
MTEKQEEKWNISLRPIIGITLVSLLICGLLYPFFITGIGQVFFPSQANGDVAKLNGQAIGSILIAQNFTQPVFFYPRPANESASSVDPDITVQMAYSQIPRISNATGISSAALTDLVNQNQQGTFWVFGNPYVDVLQLNLLLVQDYPSVYSNFTR